MKGESLLEDMAALGLFPLFDSGDVGVLCAVDRMPNDLFGISAASRDALLQWRDIAPAVPADIPGTVDPLLHPLHADRGASAGTREFRAALHRHAVPASALARLPDGDGAAQGATSLLLAAIALLMHRWSAESMVCLEAASIAPGVGEPLHFVSDRCGYRITVDPNADYAALRRTLDKARVADTVAPGASAGRFLLTYHRQKRKAVVAADVAQLVQDPAAAIVGRHDVALYIDHFDEALHLSWVFNEERFARRTIAGMADALVAAIEAIAVAPATAIGRLPLVADSVELAAPLAYSEADLGPFEFLHRRFERQAALTPDAVALRYGDETLTYRALNDQADRLARHLRTSASIGPGSIVAICIDRSLEMPLAVLAVLKAGAAYLPLDPAHPGKRLAYVLGDARAALVLTSMRYRDNLLPTWIDTICLDAPETADAMAHDAQIAPAEAERGPGSRDLAYILYTSGSTGEPKGVCVEQASFGYFVPAMLRALETVGPRRWLAVITLTFDMSLVDLFVPLCRGDSVVIAHSRDLADGVALRTQLEGARIDALQATPATWAMLIAAGWQGNPDLLAISGGEPLTRTLTQALLPRCQQLWNGYGPTEATVYSLFRRVSRDEDPLRQLSIGCGLPNITHHILDAEMRSMPAGAVGELYIGGPGIARGYHRNSELTARQFIAHPLASGHGGRLYRTGDRVRALPDGDLQYLGRIDAQIKLRGYRIEPGEIEHALENCDEVIQAVVEAGSLNGNPALIAFVKLRTKDEPPAEVIERLRRHLKSLLPPYMVPERFEVVAGFAKTSSGKLDRKALTISNDHAGTTAAVPETSLESALLEIWRAIFDSSEIGVTDNFYQLGGNSLMIAQMMSAIRAGLGYEIDYRALFEYDSVRTLSGYLQMQQPTVSSPVDSVVHAMPAGSPADTLPLTPMQLHMWLTTQRKDADASYNIPIFFECVGTLRPHLIRMALDSLAAQTPALRATFFVDDHGEVRQRILPERHIRLASIDLSALDAVQREAETAKLIEAEAYLPFDLQHAAPLRATVVSVSQERHLLLLSLHHIVGDEDSIRLLVTRLASLCESRDPSAGIETDDRHYAEYQWWRTVGYTGEQRRIDLAYWEQRLAGMPELHRVPTDMPRGPNPTFKGAMFEHSLDAAFSDRLRGFARRNKVTLYVLFHTALSALLGRLSGVQDIVIGIPTSERHRGPFDHTIGCMLNIAMLRTDLSGKPSFEQLLQTAKRDIGEAMQHDAVSLPDLAQRLNLSIEGGHATFFQILFVQQQSDYLRLPLAGMQLRQFYPERFPAKTDLIANLCERDGATTIRWEYNADLWHPDSVTRMARQLLELLNAACEAPTIPVGMLSAASAEDALAQERLNRLQVDFGPFDPPHRRFERQAAAIPQTIALLHGAQTMTYGELDARADGLADRLAAMGIGPGSVVAICCHRGMEMIVALLAAMKAGATYLPLDPSHPAERLLHIVRDAGTALVLTTHRAVSSQSLAGAAQMLFLDDPAEPSVPSSDVSMRSDRHTPDPGRDAYIIYTSGSTGEPKGVCITQGAFAHFLSAMSHRLVRPRPRRWLAVVTLAFDMSIVDLLFPLVCGDSAVIAGDDDIVDGRRLRTLIAEHGIDAMQATPSTWQSLLSAGWTGTRDMLAITGGEALTESLARALLSRCESLWNGYGPTEITVYSLLRQVHDTLDTTDLLSIGAPLPNVRHYILDDELQIVPEGVTGQLYIGGPGLARGYLNKPELTAERFIERCVDGRTERLYKTGDLVRLLPTGDIQYLGRSDNQVKIRGYRIELGEIEQALMAGMDVDRAVVDIKWWGESAVLVAFVVLADAETAQAEAISRLKKRLSERLPRYMTPQILLACTAFPLTPNGKVDRRALLRTVVREHDVVEPVGETEQGLAMIWRDILDNQNIGATSNFFAQGGHSIQITRMLYLIRQKFGAELQVGWIYEDPTLRGMAEKISTVLALKRSGQAYDSLVDFTEVEL